MRGTRGRMTRPLTRVMQGGGMLLSLCCMIFTKGIHNDANTLCKCLQRLWGSFVLQNVFYAQRVGFAKHIWAGPGLPAGSACAAPRHISYSGTHRPGGDCFLYLIFKLKQEIIYTTKLRVVIWI